MLENQAVADGEGGDVLARLAELRLHQRDGRRSPHKPLLVLLALGRLSTTGTSQISWDDAKSDLGDLLAEFGPASTTGRAQSVAYPFTRLRSDGIWILDRDVPMDNVGPLNAEQVAGQFAPSVERAFTAEPTLIASAARALVESHFPDSIAPDVLAAVGLDADAVLHAPDAVPTNSVGGRRRDPRWRVAVIQAWDRQCAFCGFDGQLFGGTVGLDAAHVRWFAFDGPDDLDNGLALCTLHHKLFDRGVLGIDSDLNVCVSMTYSARTPAGKSVYGLHGQAIQGRPGTPRPADAHITWHREQVFKGQPLTA
ncbi:HNH endonuclease [Longispora sp. K20-0274]|uniref:phosphorothioated DNA-binding restriction endonuclease n=1 Tax=Longispora sp. K20-0274 TaxID=3088255 RepID=UPI00399C434B